RTPIKHVIVIIGENHTFDNLFGAYQPHHGQTIDNLLSEGIINADGTPGPNFDKGAQQQASDLTQYEIDPVLAGPYAHLPQPATTYATGQPPRVADARFPADLPNGPFQITKYVSYDAHTGDPMHRFFQMWQQNDKGKNDLFAWAGLTVGIGPQNSAPAPTPGNTFQGGEAMGFYNMSTGDAPVFKAMADHYAISDNYHQAIMGGTGSNFIAIVTGDVAYHTMNGMPDMPPANQIENPNPQPGTNNFYTQDGYRGGSYVNCADINQPGVAPIMDYINSVPGKAFNHGNCAPSTFYLLNNYGLGYTADGTAKPLGADQFTLPPQTIPTIADALSAKGVSWKWYSGGRNDGVTTTKEYCSICDPLTGFKSIMTTPLKDNLQDVTQFYKDVTNVKTLPAVSFIRPFESKAGHPANATMSDFGNFVADIVQRVKSDKKAWASTAIIITTDEGGGYYDSGYIQPIDFFGDGTRIPLIVVSPFAKKGHVDHVYNDHASILKFIEKNWHLQPLSARSRDNLPDPVASRSDPYVPSNRPAIGNLMSLFNFDHDRGQRHDAEDRHEHGQQHD
nr:alkaline phosphatase family protein [Halothiobacillus sp.]